VRWKWYTNLERHKLVIHTPNVKDPHTKPQTLIQRSEIHLTNQTLRITKLKQLRSRRAKVLGLVLDKRAHIDAGHRTYADAACAYAAELYEFGDKHHGDGHALGVACDEDEVGLLDVVDPVEEEFPERVDALGDEAFAF
jgi:hypothetical protein